MEDEINEKENIGEKDENKIKEIILESSIKKTRTGFVFDERCLLHQDVEGNSGIPESPERLKTVMERLVSTKLLAQCIELKSRLATVNEVMMCHDEEYIKALLEGKLKTAFGDYFVCDETGFCSMLAAGSLLNSIDAVCKGNVENAILLGRPGGHHALRNRPMGFCYFAHTAIATKYANRIHGKEKILIVDWDVHHGNGTQVALEDEDCCLFISIQRNFYPLTGFNENIGKKGNAINVCFDKPFGDEEIVTVFHDIIMPVAKEYGPDLILVTNGYDAVKLDTTGGCHVSPPTYSYLTHLLMSVCKSVVLIGATGYHNEQSANCAYGCVNVLLGNPPDKDHLELNEKEYTYSKMEHDVHRENIKDVLKIHSMSKWKCFHKYKDLEVKKKNDKEKKFKEFLVREFGNEAKGVVKKKKKENKEMATESIFGKKKEKKVKKATESIFGKKKEKKEKKEKEEKEEKKEKENREKKKEKENREKKN